MAYYRLKIFLSFSGRSDNFLSMNTEELDYHLPKELIAQQPSSVRSDSRLLVLDRHTGRLTDSRFADIGKFLRGPKTRKDAFGEPLLPGDCLVLNDTKVLCARFFGRKKTGGKLEGLFLRQQAPGIWQVMLKGTQGLKTGQPIYLEDKQQSAAFPAVLLEKIDSGTFLLKIEADLDTQAILDKIGFPPLPPYIHRKRDTSQAEFDRQRYQTIYAKKNGAVAAPTAGLHFTQQLIEQLKNNGIIFAYLTLHIGTGTFKPVTADTLEEHKIHTEDFQIDSENAAIINSVKEKGGRVIAVGTTSVRTLETVAVDGKVKPFNGSTELFITPGYKFKIVDCLITNFHLPRSTLLALVAAFAGLDKIKAAYQYAIEHRYRFYSYGDAMLIL
jgi:S-adenosylmethionine:tRNA ribosyltransferase-isomerase